jgi:hypothetical protein
VADAHLGGHRQQHLLGQVHEVGVGGVRLVELQHRELGVVLARQPLVAKVPSDLVDPIEPAHHQPLQVQLGGNTQDHVQVEGVVVGGERPRRRPANDRLQHRRLHLQEASVVEELADGADDGGPLAEYLPHLGVGDEIDVALAVAQLHVLQAVPLLRQRAHRLGQHLEGFGHQGQLTGLRHEGRARGADEVPALDALPDLVVGLAHLVLLDVDLQLARPVGQLDEGRLAEAPVGDDPPGDLEPVLRQHRGVGPLGGVGGGRRRLGAGEPGQDLARGVGGGEAIGVRVAAGGP